MPKISRSSLIITKDGQVAEEIMESHNVDLHSGLDLTERTHRDLTLAEVFGA